MHRIVHLEADSLIAALRRPAFAHHWVDYPKTAADEIADIVTGRMNKVPGVTGTQTHLAFRAYSSHDLEAAFSLGE